jgi:hypothetical protein
MIHFYFVFIIINFNLFGNPKIKDKGLYILQDINKINLKFLNIFFVIIQCMNFVLKIKFSFILPILLKLDMCFNDFYLNKSIFFQNLNFIY